MSHHSFTYSSIAMLVALTLAITMYPTNAQSTVETGTTDDGENFQQFIECIFGGEVSEEDISGILDGSSDSTPTEQEIRDCLTTDTDDASEDQESSTDSDTDDANEDEDGSSEDEDESEDE